MSSAIPAVKIETAAQTSPFATASQDTLRATVTARYIAILVLLGLLLSAPILMHGLPDISIDGRNHADWTQSFARQLWNGDLYPRWLTDMNAGYGSPAFFFYPPMHAFVATVFLPLAGSSATGWTISGYSCVLATSLAGVTAWFWLGSFTNPTAALFGAAVYMIAPYHLAIDLYNRGAAAEYWIFVWLPLVMLSAERIIRRSRYAVVSLAIAYALCVVSHTSTAACFAAVPIAYVFVFSQSGSRIRSVAITSCALLIGIGLTGPFLFPAVFDQTKTYLSGYPGDYRNWWLFLIRDKITEATTQVTHLPWYLSYKMRIVVITVWTVLVSILLYRLILKNLSSNLERCHAGFFLTLTLACFFLMTRQSELVWRVVPFMRWLQFPYRLNSMIVLSVAALAGLAFTHLNLHKNRISLSVILLSLFGWLCSSAASAEQSFSMWRHLSEERIASNSEIVRTKMEPLSFWPRRANAIELKEVPVFEQFISENPPKAVAFTTNGSGDATIASWRPREIELNVRCLVAGQVVLNHFYYEGWRALRKDTGSMLPLTPSQPNGFIKIAVPQGDYSVLVQLPLDQAEKRGRVIGLLCLIACAGLTIREYSST
jgi:hypothetical protein